MTKYEHSHLASSVVWWLNYINSVGRDYIINENMIKVPATEYLERFFRDDITLELTHPKLIQRYIDLYFKNTATNEETAFEFKLVKGDSTRPLKERKRIFNDLMRMHLFNESNKQGYFLICGKQLDFNTSFKNLNLTPNFSSVMSGLNKEGFYSKWFSFDKNNPEKVIKLKYARGDYNTIYKAFFATYEESFQPLEFQKAKNIASIKTKLIFLSDDIIQADIPQIMRIGIWEVVK